MESDDVIVRISREDWNDHNANCIAEGCCGCCFSYAIKEIVSE